MGKTILAFLLLKFQWVILLINTRVILMKERVKIKLQFSQDGRSARNLGDRLDEFVSERGHLAVRFEPTVCGELLPKSLRSVGHEEETQRCHTNFVALADIGSQTGQNGMNFFGDGEDDAVEREDSAEAFGGVIELTGSSADGGQQNGKDFLQSERAESGQGNDTVEYFLA